MNADEAELHVLGAFGDDKYLAGDFPLPVAAAPRKSSSKQTGQQWE